MSEVGRTIMSVEASWEDLVAESLPGIIWSTDTALRIATCQGTDLARICASGEDLRGTSLFELFRTEDIEYPPIDAHRSALRGESCPITFTLSGIPFRGLVSPIQSAGRPLAA